jgi:hypothetical protein
MTSVFLPFIAKNVSASNITNVFQNVCQLGVVSHVDIVNKKKDGCMAYVHFASWANDEHANRFRAQIANGENVRVFYNDNQYWNVVANTYSPPTPVRNKNLPMPGAPIKKAKPKKTQTKSRAAPRNLNAEFTEDLVDASYVLHLEEELAKTRIHVAELNAKIAAMKVAWKNMFTEDMDSSSDDEA